MPIVHSNWDVLKDKLIKCDPINVERRCGNRTLVFELDELELDPDIPIISASKLHKWVKRRNSASYSAVQSPACERQETPQKAGPLSSKVRQPPQQPEPSKPAQPDPQPPNSVSKSNQQLTKSPTSVPEAMVLWKCNVDALVISETINDEFAIYADDDDDEENESEFTRNRKKIKTNAPQASKQPQAQAPGPAPRPKSPTPPPEVPSSPPQEPPPQPPPPPKPREPNWEETAKLLQDNEINTVYKDLDYFKVQAKNDKAARTILKDLVTKCVRDDETRLLLDILNLVYELGFEDDTEFWSELVLRLKRKLGNHGATALKNKTNPEIIYENYRRAMLSISQYAKSVNLEVKLPFHTMTFLIDPINNCDKVWAIEPEPTVMTKAIKVEKQENISPIRMDRRVTVGSKTISGRINFKVSKPRNGTILKQRL